MSIYDYGWNDYFQNEWNKISNDGLTPARIIADYGQILSIVHDDGELRVNRPINIQLAVGDWVVLDKTLEPSTPRILSVLPRITKFSRAAAGIEVKEQIVATNVDMVFLMQSLNRDFNLRRLERYLIAAWESGSIPIIVLTKADGCSDVAEKISIASSIAPSIAVHAISCVTMEGIDEIRQYFSYGKTIVILGSSGVGKSTLVNTLAGEELLKTQTIREDDSHGRHTTTHREIILMPEGGLILDTPGMRAFSLWEADSGMDALFGDVEALVTACRFHDCTHTNEPNCAVQEALMIGTLSESRWSAWQKLQKELAHLEAKKEGKQRLHEKQWGKQIAKLQREIKNKK